MLRPHLAAVPLLRSPPPPGARLHRHAGRVASAAGPASVAPQQTGLGAQSERRQHRREPRQARAILPFTHNPLGWIVLLRERLRGVHV